MHRRSGIGWRTLSLTWSVRHKRSRYNHKVIVDACAQCGKPADEVHHRRPQASADEDGFVGHFHKNIKHNLVALCAACHDLQHKQQRMDVHGM